MRRINIAEFPCGVAAVLLLTLAAVLVPAALAGASTFAVTNTADSGPESLRKAIEEADANPGKDSIAIGATGTIELQSALPDLVGELDVTGPGASALDVNRSATAPEFRIFNVNAGAPATPVSISGMTISNGKAETGGGIRVSSGSLILTRVTVTSNEATVVGGGILVGFFSDGGPLTLRESLINFNVVRAISDAHGGGLAAERGALIDRSTIIDNRAEVPSPSGNAVATGGGAIVDGGQSEIRQSTIAGNAVFINSAAPGLTLQGGGAFVENARILGSTIAANLIVASSPGQGANLFGGLNQSSVADTILSGPQGGPGCGGSLSSEGFNIDDGSSCAFTQPTDRSGVDPLLASLFLTNGGSIPNLALLPGSPAIDHGKAFGASTDERGKPRPSDFATIANATGGDGSDIGAFEVQALPPGPPPSAPFTSRDRRTASPRSLRSRLRATSRSAIHFN